MGHRADGQMHEEPREAQLFAHIDDFIGYRFGIADVERAVEARAIIEAGASIRCPSPLFGEQIKRSLRWREILVDRKRGALRNVPQRVHGNL